MASTALGFDTEYEEILWCVWDKVDFYLLPQKPFEVSYTYDELMQDCLEYCDNNQELLNDILTELIENDLIGGYLEIPKERSKITVERSNLGKDGIWQGLRKFGSRGRNSIAGSGDFKMPDPFVILAVRKFYGAYKQSRKWERNRWVWQLAIRARGSGTGMLTLASNVVRDNQMAWIQLNPEDRSEWRLMWKVSKAGKDYLALEKL